jgi:hypothetical protein
VLTLGENEVVMRNFEGRQYRYPQVDAAAEGDEGEARVINF